jgi:hypothetical protein
MLKSFGVGVLCASVLGLLVFALGSKTDLVTAYLWPGILIAGLLSPFVPSSIVYSLVAEGGPSAFLLQALAWTGLCWTLLFGAIDYWQRHRGRHVSRQPRIRRSN